MTTAIHIAERESDKKKRLCTDLRCKNLWNEHQKAFMDFLISIVIDMYTSSNDLGSKYDAHAGYQHLLNDPKALTWAIKWGSTLLAHPTLSFGEKYSGYAFCSVKMMNKE